MWQERCVRKLSGGLDGEWIAALMRDPIFEHHAGHVRHFVFSTGDDVVEVLSAEPPVIEHVMRDEAEEAE
jgi:hypothetical protein